MVRDTSIEAYHKIKDSKLLSRKRLQVYETVFHHGPMTSAEAFKIIQGELPNYRIVLNSRARFTELRDMGVLREVGTRVCTITGMRVIEWDVTSRLPVKPPRKKTRKEIKQEIQEILDRTTKTVLMTEDQRREIEHCYFLIYEL